MAQITYSQGDNVDIQNIEVCALKCMNDQNWDINTTKYMYMGFSEIENIDKWLYF